MAYPEWVEKYRKAGTNITCIRGKYYLYEATSKWDPVKKRAQKKTGKYLGRITENDGLIPPKEKTDVSEKISVKEYGASKFLCETGADILEELRYRFPTEGEKIFALAILRIIEKCPFKRADFLYERSYLSELFGKMALSSASIVRLLQDFGTKRVQHVGFMKEYMKDSGYILFDGTNIISQSENMDINRPGYNSHRQYDPQINLLYAFSMSTEAPGYYRVLPGNIKDVRAFRKSVEELGIKNVIIIADKGFGSEENFELLRESGMQYIVPLKRNNGYCDREKLKTGRREDFDGYFLFNGRAIWYYEYEIDGRRFIMYLDESLKSKEERDYLQRLEEKKEDYSNEGFMSKQYHFGTITFHTNLSDDPKEVYILYKMRNAIEQTFDFLKNLLDQDHTYLQSEQAVESWAFINHISLMLVYRLYSLMKNAELISDFSVQDLISHLKYIQRLKINNSWVSAEISGKTQKLLDKLNVHIT
ncbi:MAG: Uncharacterized protein AUK63_2565 [bacterium P3]|nr:MAG: Uncharacterized protein AUK63_2565 [bacterium P3]